MREGHVNVPSGLDEANEAIAEDQEEKGTGSHITRRAFIGASAALGAYVVTSRAASNRSIEAYASGNSEGDTLPGTITRIEGPSTMYIQNRGGSAVVRFSDGASFWRDGPAALTDFDPGDKILVEGEWISGTFIGTHLENLIQVVEGTIIGRNGSRFLVANSGNAIVRVTHNTFFDDPLEELTIGRDIIAIGRLDTPSRELVAWKIGLIGTAG